MQSSQNLPQFEAVALIEERRPEPGLVRENLENGGTDRSFPLEEARRLAQAILRLDGLTGAEIEGGGARSLSRPRRHPAVAGNRGESHNVHSRVFQLG